MDAAAGIVVRFALYVDLMLLFGLPAFTLLVSGEPGDGRWLKLRALAGASATIGLLLSAAGIALLAASMSGIAATAVELPAIEMLATGTAAGTAWLVRIAALALALGLAVFSGERQIARIAIALCGGTALATLAWLGHGVMDDGRTGIMHLVADITHLLAAGIWVGALAGLAILIVRPVARMDAKLLDLANRALAGFAVVGSVMVGLIVVTGLVNSWLLVGPGNVTSLGTTLYGKLLLVKLALFAAMLILAALNRFRLAPRLARKTDTTAALRSLRLSLVLETSFGVIILGLVAWLGTLATPMSVT